MLTYCSHNIRYTQLYIWRVWLYSPAHICLHIIFFSRCWCCADARLPSALGRCRDLQPRAHALLIVSPGLARRLQIGVRLSESVCVCFFSSAEYYKLSRSSIEAASHVAEASSSSSVWCVCVCVGVCVSGESPSGQVWRAEARVARGIEHTGGDAAGGIDSTDVEVKKSRRLGRRRNNGQGSRLTCYSLSCVWLYNRYTISYIHTYIHIYSTVDDRSIREQSVFVLCTFYVCVIMLAAASVFRPSSTPHLARISARALKKLNFISNNAARACCILF